LIRREIFINDHLQELCFFVGIFESIVIETTLTNCYKFIFTLTICQNLIDSIYIFIKSFDLKGLWTLRLFLISTSLIQIWIMIIWIFISLRVLYLIIFERFSCSTWVNSNRTIKILTFKWKIVWVVSVFYIPSCEKKFTDAIIIGSLDY